MKNICNKNYSQNQLTVFFDQHVDGVVERAKWIFPAKLCSAKAQT